MNLWFEILTFSLLFLTSVTQGQYVVTATRDTVIFTQMNVTTARLTDAGYPALYAGEVIELRLAIEFRRVNFTDFQVELGIPADMNSILFPNHTSASQVGFLNVANFGNYVHMGGSVRYTLGDMVTDPNYTREYLTLTWKYKLRTEFYGPVGDLSVRANIFTNGNTVNPFLSWSTPVVYLGADLVAMVTPAMSDIEAGDPLHVVLEVSPHPNASDFASDIQVQLKSLDYLDVGRIQYFVGTSRWDNSSAVNCSLSSLRDSGLSLNNLTSSSSLFIVVDGTVSELVQLNSYIPIDLHLSYYDGNKSESGQQVTKDIAVAGLLTKSYSWNLTYDLTSGVKLMAGRPVNMVLDITMGKGELSDLMVIIVGTMPETTEDYSLTIDTSATSVPSGITKTSAAAHYSRKKRSTISNFVTLGTFYNPSNSPVNSPITITLSFFVSTNVPTAPGSGTLVLVGQLTNSFGSTVTFTSTSVVLVKPPILVFSKSVSMLDGQSDPNQVLFRVTVEHDPSSSEMAYSVNMRDDSLPGMQGNIVDQHYYHYAPSGSFLDVTNQAKNFQYITPTLPVGDNVTLEYSATIDKPGSYDKTQEIVYHEAKLLYYAYSNASYPPNTGIDLKAYACISRNYDTETSILYQHGFAALSFFIALIVGALIMLLILFILIRVCKRNLTGSIRPHAGVDEEVKDKGNQLIMDPKSMKKGMNTITDLSMVGSNESIVSILALSDKQKRNREIDNLDILNTILVDTGLEKERNDAMVQASILLIQGLRINGDMNRDTEERALTNFRNNVHNLEKKLEDDWRIDTSIVYKDIGIKNKNKLGDLIKKQREEKRTAFEETSTMNDKERGELMKLIDQQHQMEQNEVTYKLKLEQDEKTEKLRKEYAARKRMGLQELQQQLLEDAKTQGHLSQQQADWLIKEHRKNQAAIDKMYDDEISRQRMILDEKLARRRALAHLSNSQEDDQSDALNTMADHQIQTIKDMKKKKFISARQAEEYIEQLKSDMVVLKERTDKDRERQERELHQRLSTLKTKRLAELAKKHENELSGLDKKNPEEQTEGPVDPLSYISSRQQMLSGQRSERNEVENDLDSEHAIELENMRVKLGEQTESEIQGLEDRLLKKLQQDGMTEEQARKILKQHDRDLEQLRASQAEERERQRKKLREKLHRIRNEALERREEEKQDQEQLREHETKLVQKLINSQMSMSEEDREKILKVHEQHMVKLENSLTLNKLRQKRMLEEKIAEKRARQMEKLEQKQQREYTKLKRSQENNAEESDEENHEMQLNVMKKHTEQKLAVLQGQPSNMEEELEGVRVEMMKERAFALKEQEERIGAMLATFQMEKARELAKIEEQQKAISNLKMNLMDDLTDRGVLSSPECQRVIDLHRQEQEILQKRLESQKIKQEKVLRQRLEQRLLQRQQTIGQMQENEVRNASQSLKNSTSIKVKKMLMLSKHMVEKEKFRNQMEREIDQTLESLRQQYDMNRMKAIQDQELKFIAGLVRLGKLKQSELVNVLNLLLPGKSTEEIQTLLDSLCEKDQPSHTRKEEEPDETDPLNESTASRLEERIREAKVLNSSRPGSRLSSNRGSIKSAGSSKKKRAKIGAPQLSDNEEDIDYETGYRTSYQNYHRPEPLGQNEDDRYVEAKLSFEQETFPTILGRVVPPLATLSPIQVQPKKKKKKGVLKKLADRHVNLEETYDYSV